MSLKHFVSLIVTLSVLSRVTIIRCKDGASAPQAQAPSTDHGAGAKHARAPAPDPEEKEQQFLDDAKSYWKKMFGALDMPPPINASINLLPPKKVMEALSAIAAREDSKNAGQGKKLDAREEATMTKQIQSSTGKLDPGLQDSIAKKLAGMFSGSDGPDPEVEAQMKRFLDILFGGGNPKNVPGVPAAGSDMKVAPQEEDRLMAMMTAAMTGRTESELRKMQKGELGAAIKAMGYAGDHATSTVLAVSKCYGPPEVDNKVHDKSVESLFFPAEELNPGLKLKLQFSKSTNNGSFFDCIQEDKTGILSAVLLMDLVAVVAKATDKTQDDPYITSEMDTIIMCDEPATKGKNKEKTCAMDLQAMVNYTISKLGKDIRPDATWLTAWHSADPIDYTVSRVTKLPAISTVGCCKMAFPFAVFYCQPFPKSVNYVISLVGDDGSSLKAPVVCHEDTSTWNPNSWIFETLKTKPGASKICHFLAADDVAWMPKTQENVAS